MEVDRFRCSASVEGAHEAPEGLPYVGNPADSRGQGGEVFALMINGAKERAPAAAMALAGLVKG